MITHIGPNAEIAKKPTPPPDCVVVLSVKDNHLCGWTLPDEFVNPNNEWKAGITFVCLTQADIDQFIPAHSEDIDEEHKENREL